jgi:hypothetical protein
MPLNPFFWVDALAPGDAVSRGEFTRRAALVLKAGTHAALFGARGTGKTTFVGQVAEELSRSHGSDAPPWDLVRVDLRRAISLPAFIGAILDAAAEHATLSRRALSEFSRLEKELSVNLGVVKVGARGRRATPGDAEILHAQLAALARIAPRLVIAFDEFQRLAHCPGEPLSIVRSALMGPQRAGRVSLLLTGSLRDRLKLLLHTSSEPIWDQTYDLELPALDKAELLEYLDLRFGASGKPTTTGAAEHLLTLTSAHPKRTQHVAFRAWEQAEEGTSIDGLSIQAAFEALVVEGSPDFEAVIDTLLAGGEPDVNEAKALYLLAGGGSSGSRKDAERYGLADNDATVRALERLRGRGVVGRTDRTRWQVIDPLFAAWLARRDPLAPGGF